MYMHYSYIHTLFVVQASYLRNTFSNMYTHTYIHTYNSSSSSSSSSSSISDSVFAIAVSPVGRSQVQAGLPQLLLVKELMVSLVDDEDSYGECGKIKISRELYVCMVYIYVRMYVLRMYVCLYMYVYILCVYVCKYVCMYIYIKYIYMYVCRIVYVFISMVRYLQATISPPWRLLPNTSSTWPTNSRVLHKWTRFSKTKAKISWTRSIE